MKRFIELTREDSGIKMIVNVDHIAMVRENGYRRHDGFEGYYAEIYIRDHFEVVKEFYSEILNLLKNSEE